MRRYFIALAIIALAVGVLWRGADDTQIRLLKMAATIGILLFGLVGGIALARWQSDKGRKEVEQALIALGMDWIITDWSGSGPRLGLPEYLVVGPGGIACLTISEIPRGSGPRHEDRLRSACHRARAATTWTAAAIQNGDLTETGHITWSPVPVLVLTRRQAVPSHSADGVTVVNPDQVQSELLGRLAGSHLSEQDRIRITRRVRSSAGKLGAKGGSAMPSQAARQSEHVPQR